MYKNLLEYIVKNLVGSPEQIEVLETEKDGKTILRLKVSKDDMGRVIGKQGRIIKSIREIIYAYAMKNSQKVSVEIEETK